MVMIEKKKDGKGRKEIEEKAKQDQQLRHYSYMQSVFTVDRTLSEPSMSGHHPSWSISILLMLTFLCMAITTHEAQAFLSDSSGSVQCSKTPPGVSKLMKGVDITTLDLLPIGLTGSDGFKSPVIDMACNDDRVWSLDGEEYQLPDQVWQMTNTPGGWLTTDVNVYKTSSDIRNSMTLGVAGQGSIWNYAFSASGSYSKLQNTITNSTRYISDVASYHSTNRVDLIPDWILQLNPIAKLYVDRFIGDKTYESDPQVYHRFINQFGTHYFSVANFGGQIRMVCETSTSYFSLHSTQEIKDEAKTDFMGLLSANGGSTTEDSRFADASTQTVRYYGGSANLLSTDGINSWQPTVDENPWLLSGELKPISNLITNDIQRSSMERAVLQHVMQSYLGELRRLVASINLKLGSSPTTDDFEERLTVMEAQPLGSLVEADVYALGKDIDNQITIPFWFSENTRFCYQWRPDGDRGQCGAGEDRLLCAPVGRMTPFYRDDSDNRGGGCLMQWSIQSTGFDSWFYDVQVCFHWEADVNNAQCGGGANHTLCAPVNEFSPEYRDDTDDRIGGCQMTWTLSVPDSAPLWMKATKLCFSWYPDGHEGQCGPSQSRDMCAVTNEWTPYYRDDTDVRKGGCRMSWGLQSGL
ncbi:hypothetical protein PoB_005238300 [Plakobranchus ocellatus]|uniref:MACPF domain-containing protein n=1 Tax=Plakobranchus ocellatus TaxID=259542 RepID=A0AAV4C387_9GAST|nr:hypothetical protein PoB_005238300 [Plakobranchus ocellatus]